MKEKVIYVAEMFAIKILAFLYEYAPIVWQTIKTTLNEIMIGLLFG